MVYQEWHLQVVIVIELAVMRVPAFKFGLGIIERELIRKPVKYGDTD
jgi:hypothetical protein